MQVATITLLGNFGILLARSTVFSTCLSAMNSTTLSFTHRICCNSSNRNWSGTKRRPSFTTNASLKSSGSNEIKLPPLPADRIVVGVGTINTDYLATVAAFPQPDEKIRTSDFQIQGGGNVGNAFTGAARLGLNPRIISKVANDASGRKILSDLENDGIDISYMVVSEIGNSPLTYIIVDQEMKTRTCIHSPGSPPMSLEDISQTRLISSLEGATLVYFDVGLPQTAIQLAKEAKKRHLPIFVDAEKKREGLDELLSMADYVVCSGKFPLIWTEATSIADALVTMAVRLPNLRFVIVTLGDKGCIMLERNMEEAIAEGESVDPNFTLEQLTKKVQHNSCHPMAVTSEVVTFKAPGKGNVQGRILVGTAEAIPPSELVDTTGAGDAFIGAVLYGIVVGMPPEKMLPFANTVGAAGCRAVGARPGMPYRKDPRLAPYLRSGVLN